jgi:hypothetical protein
MKNETITRQRVTLASEVSILSVARIETSAVQKGVVLASPLTLNCPMPVVKLALRMVRSERIEADVFLVSLFRFGRLVKKHLSVY